MIISNALFNIQHSKINNFKIMKIFIVVKQYYRMGGIGKYCKRILLYT